MRKGQAAVEFAIGLSILFFLFMMFMVAITNRAMDSAKENLDVSAKFVEDTIVQEVGMASSFQSGYSRNFSIPRYLSGLGYDIDTQPDFGSKVTSVTLTFPGYANYEYTFYVHQLITGDFRVGDNNIVQINNQVKVNPL